MCASNPKVNWMTASLLFRPFQFGPAWEMQTSQKHEYSITQRIQWAPCAIFCHWKGFSVWRKAICARVEQDKRLGDWPTVNLNSRKMSSRPGKLTFRSQCHSLKSGIGECLNISYLWFLQHPYLLIFIKYLCWPKSHRSLYSQITRFSEKYGASHDQWIRFACAIAREACLVLPEAMK